MILVADTLQAFKPVEAEQLLRRALKLDPRNPMALFILSDVLSRQQKMAEAEKVLRDSIQISQNSYTPHSKLGDLFLQLRRYEEAEASFLKALQTASPTEKTKLAGLQGFTGVGDGFMKVKKFREAVRAYSKAKQIDPQNSEIAAKLTSAERVAF
jgi:tetratricopeptide (TPR) repeat protein